jgi:hypothetical protein
MLSLSRISRYRAYPPILLGAFTVFVLMVFSAPSHGQSLSNSSGKTAALTYTARHRAAATTSPWKLDRTKFYDRLEALIKSPEQVTQDGLGLCGPASFLTLWLKRDPLAVAEFACQLYETGKSSIGPNYQVAPKPGSLIATDYAAIKAARRNPDKFCPEADWLLLGSLRDASDIWLNYQGRPDDRLAADTRPGEVQSWLEATQLYSSVKNQTNCFATKPLAHALALQPSRNTDIVLMINSHMIKQMNVTKGLRHSNIPILNAFPNHFIVLLSPIQEIKHNRLQLDFWSYGALYSGTIEKSIFAANYYGAIIAKK